MAVDGAVTVSGGSAITDATKNPFSIIAQVLRGGAIVEVTTIDQAKIAESAGACCIVVSEPKKSGISRMPDRSFVKEVKAAIAIPVMVRARDAKNATFAAIEEGIVPGDFGFLVNLIRAK